MQPLPPERLRLTYDVQQLPHDTTAPIEPLDGIIGQERAVRALRFGLGMRDGGYHIFVSGPPGTGRTTAVQSFLQEFARGLPTPADWCYVNNFTDPYRPQVLQLPAGRGRELQRDVAALVAGARRRLGEAFEGDQYIDRREAVVREFQEQQRRITTELERRAQEQGFTIQATPVGLIILPVVQGRPLTDKDLIHLDPLLRADIQRRQQDLQEQMRDAFKQMRSLEKEAQQRLVALDRDVAQWATGGLVDDLLEKYADLPGVVSYLKEVHRDIIDHLDPFRGGEAEGERGGPERAVFGEAREMFMRRYQVNVVVDNGGTAGAPVVIEGNPTYPNLFGRIEKEARMGVLSTDFTLLRGGSLHQANGGFLVVQIEEMLKAPFVWDSLKRALRQREIEVEEQLERMGFLAARTLRPLPIPLDIKVVLIGSPQLYYLLNAYDPDFGELFKVKAEFAADMDRTPDNEQDYLAFLCTLCRKESLRHLDRGAVGKMLEYACRMAAHQQKLSTRFAEAADVVREANYWAGQDGAELISAGHIDRAIDEKVYRLRLIQDRVQELIRDGTIRIAVDGEAVGQVNGLAVLSLGNFAFGRPSRITATVGPGRGGVLNIEREARLSGRIHTKGVLILEGYLTEIFAREAPLSLTARVVFEQTYEEVDGDSASSTELYAILSALSGLPIRQGLAVTGSVNQKGEVQAIGGVNEKIEGFFDVCRAQGLTGKQGVLVPAANVPHLMLREDVVAAAADGQFHIYPVTTIAEGIELLTGVPAGERGSDGRFAPATVFGRVEARLRRMAALLKEQGLGGRAFREAAAARDSGADREADPDAEPGAEPDAGPGAWPRRRQPLGD